jgi:hypothetical protein
VVELNIDSGLGIFSTGCVTNQSSCQFSRLIMLVDF